jgi:hypothetical protein
MADPQFLLPSTESSPASWSSVDCEDLIVVATTFIYEGTTTEGIPSKVVNLSDYDSALTDLIAFVFEGAP